MNKDILFKAIFGFMLLVVGLMIAQAFLVHKSDIPHEVIYDESQFKERVAYLEKRIRALKIMIDNENMKLNSKILELPSVIERDEKVPKDFEYCLLAPGHKQAIKNIRVNINRLKKEQLDLETELLNLQNKIEVESEQDK